jgi:hypothetical protein
MQGQHGASRTPTNDYNHEASDSFVNHGMCADDPLLSIVSVAVVRVTELSSCHSLLITPAYFPLLCVHIIPISAGRVCKAQQQQLPKQPTKQISTAA